MKKTKIFSLILTILMVLPAVLVHAQSSTVDTGLSDTFGLGQIVIPFFPVFGTINSKYLTVLSWITFAADILIIVVIIFWIVRILLAGLEAIKSEGNQDKLAEAFKKLQANLVGIGMTFLVPVVLTIIGFLLGIGSIFNWPKMFSGCSDPNYDYYFKAYFNAPPGEDATEFATRTCQSTSNT